MRDYYIAIDFDGTLVEDKFPRIGKTRTRTINKLADKYSKLLKKGYRMVVILWTCRAGKYLDDAIDWCEENLPIYLQPELINENPKHYHGSPKIYANEYWDDRARRIR